MPAVLNISTLANTNDFAVKIEEDFMIVPFIDPATLLWRRW